MDKYCKKLCIIFSFMFTIFVGMVICCAKNENLSNTKMLFTEEVAESNANVFFENEVKIEKANNPVKQTKKSVSVKEKAKANSNIKSNNIKNSNSLVNTSVSNKVKSNSNTLNKTSNTKVEEKKYIDKIPVFTFHRLVPDKIKKKYYKNNAWVSSEKVFESMIKYLHDNGYETISTLELYDWYTKKIEYDKKVVVITFDDGYIEDYYLAYPILKKYNFKATSFLIGSKIEDITPKYDDSSESYSEDPQLFIGQDVIDKVREEYPNFEFQSHTYDLHSKVKTDIGRLAKVYTLTIDEIDEDVKNTLKYNFKTMAYPFGLYNDFIQDKLKENGYLLAFTFGSETYNYATRDSEQYAMNRIKIDGDATLDTLIMWLDY